jgi:hypothetical protein
MPLGFTHRFGFVVVRRARRGRAAPTPGGDERRRGWVFVAAVERCVVHLGRPGALRSLFFAGPVWSVHADERKPDGLTYA